MINSRSAEYFEKWKIAAKIYALDMLGGQCVKCGQTNIFALQFDHIKPTRMSRGRGVTSGGFVSSGTHTPALILNGHEDLSNLQILCASCHSIKTYYEGNRGNITKRSLNKKPAQEVN